MVKMMEFSDIDERLLEAFDEDFFKTGQDVSWDDFIDNSDLGIIYKERRKSREESGHLGFDIYFDVYEVVDEKKWLLTRLKYGI